MRTIVQAGAVLNPHTPEDFLRYILVDLDLVLLMTVNPGFGGQEFIPGVVPKIQAVRRLIAILRNIESLVAVARDFSREVVDRGTFLDRDLAICHSFHADVLHHSGSPCER